MGLLYVILEGPVSEIHNGLYRKKVIVICTANEN